MKLLIAIVIVLILLAILYAIWAVGKFLNEQADRND